MSRMLMALMVLLLSACASQPKPDETAQAWLKPGVRGALPTPEFAKPFNQQQLLTATVDGKQQSLLVLVSADGKSLQIAGLSPLGIRLFKATYDAQGIHTEQAINIAQLPPANQVLADIMFCYWPVSRWQPLLPAGWTLKDQGTRRILADNQGREVTRIDYLQRGAERQPVSITQRAFHYQITIQNVDN